MPVTIRRPRYDVALWLIVGVAMLAWIAGAIGAGGDVNWDFRDYHYYNAWLALHGGHSHDFFPAQIQAWLNPALDIPPLLAIEYLPPQGLPILIATAQSLSLPLLALLLHRTLTPIMGRAGAQAQLVTEIVVLIAAVTAPMTLSELGTVFGDLELAPLALGTLLCLAEIFAHGARGADKKTLILAASAGLCAGLAAGLKLTYLIYLPGFVAMLLFVPLRWIDVARLIATFGFGCLAGGLITGGPWAYILWQQTGNPVFPAANGIFHSPLIDQANIIIDQRFYARSITDALLFPFRTAIGDHPGSEPYFTDVRFAITTLLAIIIAFRRPKGWTAALLAFFSISYALWLPAFGIERYIVLLELLAPLIIALLISLVAPPSGVAGMMAGTCLAILLLTSYPDWINRVGWDGIGKDGNWFNVSVPPELQQAHEMFVTSGWLPTSFVIPSLPADAQQIRINGDFEPGPQSRLFQKRTAAIMSHRGPAYLLTSGHPDTDETAALRVYGWRRDARPCLTINSNFEPLFACPLELIR